MHSTRWRMSAALALAALGTSTWADVPVIVTNTSNLLPNTPNQQVKVFITGTDSIVGEQISVQINSGASGPTFTGAEILTGTIFAGNNTGQNNAGIINSGTAAGHIAVLSTSTNSATVSNNGTLMTLLISTNASSGTFFDINLINTLNGPTFFVLANTSVVNATQQHVHFSIGAAPIRQWTFNGNGTWDLDSHWTPFAPYAIGDAANFLGALSTGIGTVTLDGNRVAGSITFNNTSASYLLAPGTGGSLKLDNGAAAPFISNLGGNHAISAPLLLTANTNVNVANLGNTLTLSGLVSGGTFNVVLTGGGSLVLAGGESHTVGGVSGGGNLKVAAATTLTSNGLQLSSLQLDGTALIRTGLGNAGTSKVNTIGLANTVNGSSVTYTGTLNLADSRLIVEAADSGDKATKLAALVSAIRSGSNGGTWTGTGITSSAIVADINHLGVGLFDNALLGFSDFGGTGNVDANSILVAVAHLGDVNRNGVVDIQDLTIVGNNWTATPGHPAHPTNWAQGDLNLDGVVDIQDFTIVANNWQQASSFNLTSGELPLIFTSTVPEPGSLLILGFGITSVVWKRRQRR